MRNTFKRLLFPVLAGFTVHGVSASGFHGADFYADIDYRGSVLTLYPGEGIDNLTFEPRTTWNSWNDEISSVAVWGDVVVYLYEHSYYRGRVVVLADHAPDLFYTEWGNFNDVASSIYVDWYYPDGWLFDSSLQSWVYWEDGWFYHEEGLGWLYGGYFDRTYGSGWLHDEHFGWIYTDYQSYPWFYSESWGALMFLHGSMDPRWWYRDPQGWIEG